jgi:hypothetical protein
MTEGYAPKTGTLDDEGADRLTLRKATPDDVLDAMKFGMAYKQGKLRSRAADDLARSTVAQMIYDHLELCGFVILQKPPAKEWSISSFKKHLTE